MSVVLHRELLFVTGKGGVGKTTVALAVAIAVSLVVNDSPNDVATAGLVGFVVCGAVMLRARCAAASCLRSPSAFSWPVAVERPPWRPRPRR
jgi:hypothetical protein